MRIIEQSCSHVISLLNFGDIDSLHYDAVILKVGGMHLLMRYSAQDAR
jgi:hypothetical protein